MSKVFIKEMRCDADQFGGTSIEAVIQFSEMPDSDLMESMGGELYLSSGNAVTDMQVTRGNVKVNMAGGATVEVSGQPTAVEPSWPDPTAELPFSMMPDCLRRPIIDWGRDWRVLVAACLIAWACGGCIAPTYNIFVGGDHKHGEKHATDVDQKTDGTDTSGMADGGGTTGLFGPPSRGNSGLDGR